MKSIFLFILIPLLFIAIDYKSQNCDDYSLSDITNPGPFEYGTLTEADGLRDGPDYFEGTLYYPIGAPGPYASIAIVPGFFSDEADIEDWGPFLASNGIVTFTIGTNSYGDFPGTRGEALLDALESVRQENVRFTSPLFGLIDDTKFAVSGWSMGGGGAQYAAVEDPSLKAVVALCPWLNFNQPEFLNHAVPLLILSGENDAVAPVNSHANTHYANTPATTDKLIFEIDNGSHSVANYPTGGNGDAGKIALAWLRYYLLDEPCYCPLMTVAPTTSSDFNTNVVCVTPQDISLNIKTYLEGPFNGLNMNDDLRNSGHIPLTEPFTNIGYNTIGSGGEQTTEAVLNITGNNAIVDWIFVELRDGLNASSVLQTKSALLQKDGDVVGIDGVSPVIFTDIVSTDIAVALRHRNHLGVRSESFSSDVLTVDFTDPNFSLYGTGAMKLDNGIRLMYAGNANYDAQINVIDNNNFWRTQNAMPYSYMGTNADFDLNGAINALDKNVLWRVNNSISEQLD